MASFKDNMQREWTLCISVATIKRVKELTGVNLGLLLNDEMSLLQRVLGDPIELVNVVYAICQHDCDRMGITDEQFGEALAGDSFEHCIDAFMEAVIDFFPSRQGKILRAIVNKTNDLRDALAKELEEQIEEKYSQTLTKLASRSPESSE